MKQDNTKKMTEKKIGPLLLSFAFWSVLCALLLSALNNIDSFFAKEIGGNAIEAVGVVFTVHAMLQTLGYFIGLGAASLISKELGKKEGDAAPYFAAAYGLLLVCSVLVTVFGNVFINPILSLLGTKPEAYDEAHLLLRYFFFGSFFVIGAYTCLNLIRALGKMRLLLFLVFTGLAVNVGCHMLFVRRLHLGVHGIGMAVLAGYIVLSILCALVLAANKTSSLRKQMLIKNWKQNWKRESARVLLVMKNGIPSLVRQGALTGSIAVLNRMAAAGEEQMLSAMAVSQKILLFVSSLSIGISQAMQPLVGCNLGAGKKERVKQTFLSAVISGTLLMVLLVPFLYVFAPSITSWFLGQEDAGNLCVRLLRIQCFALPFLMLSGAANMLYQASVRPFSASVIAALRQAILLFPVLFLLHHIIPEKTLFYAQPIADGLTFLVCIPFSIHYFKSEG